MDADNQQWYDIEDAEHIKEAVAQFVEPRQKMMQSMLIPNVLAVVAVLVASILESLQLGRVSPMLLLLVIFSFICVMAGSAFHSHREHIDHISIGWRRVMAIVVLGWQLTAYFVVGYHSTWHDLGGMRLGGSFLALFVAQSSSEASLYLGVHLMASFGAKVPNLEVELFYLIMLDLFMLFAAYGKSVLDEVFVQLMFLSFKVSTCSFASVQHALEYLCDATIVVDSDLRILGSSPGLEAMLRQTRTKDRSLHELVYHEDVEEFQCALKHRLRSFKNADTRREDTVQVRLVDTYGTCFSVYMFVAASCSRPNKLSEPHHLLGILEQSQRRGDDALAESQSTNEMSASSALRHRTSTKAAKEDVGNGRLDDIPQPAFSMPLMPDHVRRGRARATPDGPLAKSTRRRSGRRGDILLGAGECSLPTRLETPDGTVDQLIYTAIKGMSVRALGCCNRHKNLAAILQRIIHLSKSHCTSDWTPFEGAQCCYCLAMQPEEVDDANAECQVCGSINSNSAGTSDACSLDGEVASEQAADRCAEADRMRAPEEATMLQTSCGGRKRRPMNGTGLNKK